jgi:hypothetical protein
LVSAGRFLVYFSLSCLKCESALAVTRTSASLALRFPCWSLLRLGEVGGDPAKYWEPGSNAVYTVDHVAMKVVGDASAAPPAGPDEETRAALQAAVTYMGGGARSGALPLHPCSPLPSPLPLPPTLLRVEAGAGAHTKKKNQLFL